MAKRWVNSENSDKFYFLGLQNHSDGECSHQMKRHLIFFIRKAMTNLDSILKSRDVTLPAKVYKVTSYGFSSSHVWMLELHYKKGWASKNWWFWTVVLEKTLESPLDCKEINPVHPKGDHSWIFIGRTDAETEVPILWPHDAKNWLIGKDSDAGKDWWQEEKGVTEDKIVGWHHQLNGHEFEHSRRWWRTGKPGVLQFTGLQRAIHNLVPEQQQPGKYGFALKQNLGSFIYRKFPPLIVVKNIWTHIYIMKWAVSEKKEKREISHIITNCVAPFF